MVTVSVKRNRVYTRKFPHEEAAARAAAGESTITLAREYGVSETAVRRIVDPIFKANFEARANRYLMSGVCATCGKTGISRYATYCKPCSGLAIASTVRTDTLQCAACRRWLPDEAFYAAASGHIARRGKKSRCRACDNRARRDYRHRQKVPCTSCGRPTSPAGKDGRRTLTELCNHCSKRHPRKEQEMSLEGSFVVFVQEKEGLWREQGRVNARDKRDALAAAFNGNPPPDDQLVAVVSTQAFRPGRLVPVQVYDLETAE